MLKASAFRPEGPLLIFGLSHGNLDRLRAGRPIRIDLTELGLGGDIVIFAGETEESMKAEFDEMIGPETEVRGL